MKREAETWVVVLAGGDGTRVRALSLDASGRIVPKQFNTFGSARSLLQRTIDRAGWLVPPERIVAVVAEKHRGLWEHQLEPLPPRNVLSQPANKGTAVGVLAGLIRVLRTSGPEARILLLPSDHEIGNEATLRASLLEALERVETDGRPVLLGVRPGGAAEDYGWIVTASGPSRRTRDVARFVEKPGIGTLSLLRQQGALVSTAILAASVGMLLELFRKALPSLLETLMMGPDPGTEDRNALERLYARLPSRDLSHDVLEQLPRRLSVMNVPDCGWVDLGTPARLTAYLAGVAPRERPRQPAAIRRAPLTRSTARLTPVTCRKSPREDASNGSMP